MSAGWVAGSVRARALARRRLGAEQTRRLASCGSLSDALRMLAATAYGVNLRPEQPLAVAQHEIAGSVLWDLRVLAGWLPSEGVQVLRVLGAWFEVAGERFAAGRAVDPAIMGSALSLLGPAALRVATLEEMAGGLPPRAGWVLTGVTGPADLWRAEQAWLARVERDGLRLLRTSSLDSGVFLGAVAAMACDAWRVRAALEIAARGGESLEAYDELA